MLFCYREKNCFYTHTLCEEIHIDTPFTGIVFLCTEAVVASAYPQSNKNIFE